MSDRDYFNGVMQIKQQEPFKPLYGPLSLTPNRTLAEAIATVCAMTDEEFFDAAKAVGLDPYIGRPRLSTTGRVTYGVTQ